MKHNKWAVISLGCLVACAIPGDLGMMLGVLVQVALAGVCFAKWIIEEDKYQRAMYEKFLEDLKKGVDKTPSPCYNEDTKKRNEKEINTMATMRFEMTYHAKEERIDRLTACIQYLGFNEIIKEELEIRHNRNVVRKLTDTGIILICGEDGCLITGFMGTMAQVGTFYKGQDIPKTMKQRVRKNNEKYAFLLKM